MIVINLRCQQCQRPLHENDGDLLCPGCEWQVGQRAGFLPPLAPRPAQLIWRAIAKLQPLEASDARMLASQLRECSRLLMAAVAELEDQPEQD